MKNNKRVYLIGGLGNNLFQINKGYHLEDSGYDVTYCLFFLNSNFITNLLNWSSHDTSTIDLVLRDKKVSKDFSLIDFFLITILFILKKIKLYDMQSFYCSSNFDVEVGYFQDDFIVNNRFLTDLRFILEPIYSNCSVNNNNYIVLHARLGDFDVINRLPIDYYYNCIISSGYKNVIVITDTPSFKINLLNSLRSYGWQGDITLYNGNSVIDDFVFIAHSENLIMSNSTFCFWASQIVPVNNVFYPTFRRPDIKWPFNMLNLNKISIKSFE